MTTIAELFPSKYVAACDLAGELEVFVTRIDKEEVGEDKEAKPILYFEGKKKGMVLNVTNARRIASVYGDRIEDWLGKPIILYPSETDFKGDTVACIRVKVPEPKPATETAGAATGTF